MTRKEFLWTAAGAVAVTAASSSCAAAVSTAVKKGPKRGVSLFSYCMELYYRMSLEDCLAHIADLGTPEQGYKMGLEILGNAHIEGYPNPSTAWVDNWHSLMAKYNLLPEEYGLWTDSKLKGEGPEDFASTEEELSRLVQDIKLASLLGFTRVRSRYGLLDNDGTLQSNWREVYKAALPVAEKHNVYITEEFHCPVKSKAVDDLVDFIEKEKTGKWFSINPDFGVFARFEMPPEMKAQIEKEFGKGFKLPEPSEPKELIPLLPYTGLIHAKFGDMTRDCVVKDTPYPELIKILLDHKWDGYLISEYQGRGMFEGKEVVSVRQQHVQLKRLLGEA
ncbi:MAG: sugar phosphate isomerase/epimerase [Bryobacterales bacterium]|nr:sugar phosphate isomerase/epimerase [Bryobacterales bacterium]